MPKGGFKAPLILPSYSGDMEVFMSHLNQRFALSKTNAQARVLPRSLFALGLFACLLQAPAWAQDANAQLKAYASAAKSTPSAQAGETFFNSKHGGDWSCATCHGTPPTGQGKHAVTSKPIAPMAPAFNAERFTDTAKSEKWFRRNCKDVLSRECTDAEKANVLAYLLSLKK